MFGTDILERLIGTAAGKGHIDAVGVFDGPCLRLPAKPDEGEARSMAIGRLDDVPGCIIYTMRGSVLRMIFMRKARDGE